MDYTKYNIEDFAANESFIDWVNQSDPEAIKFWNLYISEHPEITHKVEQARILIQNLKRAESIDFSYTDEYEYSLWNKIQERVESQSKSSERPRVKRMAILATLFIGISCLGVYISSQLSGSEPSASSYQNGLTDYVEQVNETGKALLIHLSDGSTISLESKSRLKYKADYSKDSTREVYLIGEAFFDIAKNPYKPFIVHSNEVLTKVLGTSFRVMAPDKGENIIVSVKTGKVSVYERKEATDDQKDGVILYPNQQVTYVRAQQAFDKTLIEEPEIINSIAEKSDFVFENAPMEEVFKVLETAYGIEIMYNEEIMKSCFITAPLGSEPLFEKLKIICQTIGATYEVIDAKVIISSTGC